MAHSPLTLSRRHVLGDLYARFERLESVPIYWNDALSTPVGFVDESTGHYADAFTFHIPEEFCKKLSAGQILCSFNYEFADKASAQTRKSQRKLRVTSFILAARTDVAVTS